MGSKRSYDGQEPLQLPYKFSKQLATDEKLISFTDEKLVPNASIHPCNGTNDKLSIPSNCLVLQANAVGHNNAPRPVDPSEISSYHDVQNVVGIDDLGFPLATDSHGDDYSRCRDFQRSSLPIDFESYSPRGEPAYDNGALSSFLDCNPRKQVPIGTNFQADLPEQESSKAGSSSVGASNSFQVFLSDEEKLVMGTCIIPMPDCSLPIQNNLPARTGRKDCECVDRASVRCVRQHVNEARDRLIKALGADSFHKLGFLDIGEEVAQKWSEEEEQVFHEVVFSNPASLGKDFWSCLLDEFPTRSIRDLVSYYFNVFMLRKRAEQNRSRYLDIDSDDDEWHPGHGRSYGIGFAGEDDDSVLNTDEDSSGEDDNSDGDENTGYADADEEESSQQNMRFLHKGSDFNPVFHDNSCISFGYQSGVKNCDPAKPGRPAKELNGLNTDEGHFSSNQTDLGSGLSHGCLYDSSHFRLWDQGFSAGLDHLLPTQNMFEEIFAPGCWDNKPDHD